MAELSDDEIDCMIDEWHEADTDRTVYEYLGMTREEYGLWLMRSVAKRGVKFHFGGDMSQDIERE